MAKTIKVALDLETQEMSVDLDGFHGVGCADITKAFEELGEVSKSIKKPEYREKQQKCVVNTK